METQLPKVDSNLPTWILCKQISNDFVSVSTSLSDTGEIFKYKNFLDFVGQYGLSDFLTMREMIDKFKYVLIFPQSKEWEEFKEDKEYIENRKELLKLNPKESEQKVVKDEKIHKQIEIKRKSYLDKYSDLLGNTRLSFLNSRRR